MPDDFGWGLPPGVTDRMIDEAAPAAEDLDAVLEANYKAAYQLADEFLENLHDAAADEQVYRHVCQYVRIRLGEHDEAMQVIIDRCLNKLGARSLDTADYRKWLGELRDETMRLLRRE